MPSRVATHPKGTAFFNLMVMIIKRVTQHYAQIPNAAIVDDQLSAGAFRVLAYLFSLPNDWRINNSDIKRKLGINDNSTIAKYWKEIEAAGWCTRERVRDAGQYVSDGLVVSLFETKDVKVEKPQIMENTNIGKNTHLTNTNLNTNTQRIVHTVETNNSPLTTFELKNKQIAAFEKAGRPYLDIFEEITFGLMTEQEIEERYNLMLNEVFASQVWYDDICIHYKIPAKSATDILKRYFTEEIKIKGNQHQNLWWVKSHFVNWYQRNYTKKKYA